MAQAGYAVEQSGRVRQPANDFRAELARPALTGAVFADRPGPREEMRADAEAAGLRICQCGSFADVLASDTPPLADVVLIDCPMADAARLAALARVDMRAARSAVQLVVVTSVAALDDVFACLDQSRAQILVEPRRAERVIALGRAMARAPGSRLREFSEEDRLYLLRLTEQVDEVARRLDRIGLAALDFDYPAVGYAADERPQVESPPRDFRSGGEGDGRMERAMRPALPDPRLIRRIIRQRQLRARFFDSDLFADPAWDMLLDLTAARAEHKRVSVTSLCIASAVPPTTALRWIGQMTEAGLLERVEDEADRRRAFIALTDRAADAIARYFIELGRSATQMV